MTIVVFIIGLFVRAYDELSEVTKHALTLHPREVIKLGILFTVKEVVNHTFYRWLVRDYFSNCLDQNCLFRLFIPSSPDR